MTEAADGWTAFPDAGRDWRPEDRYEVDGVAVWARERSDEPGVVEVELVEAPATGPSGMTTGVVPRHPVTPEEFHDILRESVEYLTSDHDCD